MLNHQKGRTVMVAVPITLSNCDAHSSSDDIAAELEAMMKTITLRTGVCNHSNKSSVSRVDNGDNCNNAQVYQCEGVPIFDMYSTVTQLAEHRGRQLERTNEALQLLCGGSEGTTEQQPLKAMRSLTKANQVLGAEVEDLLDRLAQFEAFKQRMLGTIAVLKGELLGVSESLMLGGQ
jgi:hypothetical protein